MGNRFFLKMGKERFSKNHWVNYLKTAFLQGGTHIYIYMYSHIYIKLKNITLKKKTTSTLKYTLKKTAFLQKSGTEWAQ